MNDFIPETMKTPVHFETSVLVAGGGIAGISAALAAARNGADVTLVESQYALGGLATLGLITMYLPLCDGMGKQVIYGIGEELLRLSIRHGAERAEPLAWLDPNGSEEDRIQNRFRAQYNPAYFILESEKLLLSEKVRILYGTKLCAVLTEEMGDKKRVTAAILESKEGRFAIRVKGSLIDCTGDADAAFFAHSETKEFMQGNILAAWYYSSFQKDGLTKRKLNVVGASDISDEEKQKTGKTVKLLEDRRYRGLDSEEISLQVQDMHRHQLLHISDKQGEYPDWTPHEIPTVPQIRMTRRIVGLATPGTESDHAFCRDSVGVYPNWRKRGPVYELPFGAIVSADTVNLLAAGRNISVSDALWDVTRVIPVCAVSGEAAGTAAALSDNFHTLPVKTLQETLRKNGVRIHLSEL